MLERIKQAMRARLGDESDAAARATVKQGFTLVELLIVVVVLGILAAVTVFGLSGTTGTSHQAACNSDVRSVEVAVEAYHANNNPTWPPNMAALIAPDPRANDAPYLRTLPADTHYAITTDGQPAHVHGTCPDAPGQDYDARTQRAPSVNPCECGHVAN